MQIEYGFSIDKLTNQFLSKLPQLISSTPSMGGRQQSVNILQPLEHGISESLGRIKGAIMELAGGIQERINSYYQACNAVSQAGLKERIADCKKALEDVEKARGSRENLRQKIELNTKEIALIERKARELKTPEKDPKKIESQLADAKKKREKEWKAKFDSSTNELNASLGRFAIKIKRVPFVDETIRNC